MYLDYHVVGETMLIVVVLGATMMVVMTSKVVKTLNVMKVVGMDQGEIKWTGQRQVLSF